MITEEEYLIKHKSPKECLRTTAFKNNFTNTSLLISALWKLRDENTKYFSELEMLLSMNDAEETVKMKKGITTVAKTLIEQGEKLLKYTKKEEKRVIQELDDSICIYESIEKGVNDTKIS